MEGELMSGFDYNEFKKFRDNFQNLVKDCDKFLDDFLIKEGMRCVRATKKLTPGPTSTGRLRNAWELVGPFKRYGNERYVVIRNNTKYASWVEDGHRVVNQYGDTGKWRKGVHMARIALTRTQLKLDKRFEKAFGDFCKGKGLN